MGRPHNRCNGFGRADRVRVPSPAASTTAVRGRPDPPARGVVAADLAPAARSESLLEPHSSGYDWGNVRITMKKPPEASSVPACWTRSCSLGLFFPRPAGECSTHPQHRHTSHVDTMPTLPTTVDVTSDSYRANRAALEAAVALVDEQLALARAGGGERYVARHRERGKLPARERIELLLDRDTAFLELCPLAGWGSQFAVGASSITGIGVVEGIECFISANDPTVRGGAMNPFTFKKGARGSDCLLYTSPSPRDRTRSRMPSS